LKKDHFKSRRRKAERPLAEAIAIQNGLDKGEEAAQAVPHQRSAGRRPLRSPDETGRYDRSKDAIEKLFHSLKSEVEIKPVRVWTEDAVYGVLLIGFIAQLMISLTRFFVKPVKRMSTKFIIASLQNLTETVVSMGNGLKKRFFSNFNEVNKAILADLISET